MSKTWIRNRGGERLGQLLRENRESQATLERRLGLGAGYVSDAIKGKARPSYAKRARFCVEFGIPLHLWDEKVETKEEARP